MEIFLKKTTKDQCEYKIIRSDKSTELISLDMKTYFVHDITHFVVEKNLGYSKGFWGMLSNGYAFNELFGKENPLTAELRFIEKVVGPVQSVFLGYIPTQHFPMYLSHLNFDFKEGLLETCIAEIKSILEEWEQLKFGQMLSLEWH